MLLQGNQRKYISFLLKAISEKNALITKAALPVPKHLEKQSDDCCVSLKSNHDALLNLPIYPDANWKFETLETTLDNDSILLPVENFHGDASPGTYFDEEGVEVVPSSNPESQNDGSEFPSTFSTEEQRHIKPFCEKFSRHIYETGEHSPVEEPIIAKEIKEASLIIPPVGIIASKFQALTLCDPCRKENGTLWKEQDFFPIGLLKEVSEPLVNQNCIIVPESVAVFHKNVIDREVEHLMSPVVPEHVPDCFKADMCKLEVAERGLSAAGYENCSSPFPAPAFSSLLEGANTQHLTCLEKCESVATGEDQFLFFYNLNLTDAALSSTKGDSHVPKEKTTPLLEMRDIHVVDSYPIAANNFLTAQEALRELELKKDENLTTWVSLMEPSEHCSFEYNVWLKEKYNDEMQIPEPTMDPPTGPVPVLKEIVETVGLKMDLEDSSPAELFTQPPVLSIPLLNIVNSEREQEIPSPKPPEDFQREEAIGRNFSDPHKEDLETASSFGPPLRDTKDVTLESKTMKMIYWNQQTDEENNPLESFLFLRKEKTIKEQSIEPPAPHRRSEANMDVHATETVNSTSKQGFEIKLLGVPFLGPLEGILQCLIDCAEPHLECMKRAQRIAPEEDLMNISVDFAKFLFKESEKQAVDQELSGDVELQASLCLYTLRVAAHYLVNVSLESCCSYLATQTEHWKQYLKDSLENVLEKVYQMQVQVLRDNILHPLQKALWLEVNRFCTRCSGSKLLVVVPCGFPDLLQTIKSMLCKVAQLVVTVLPNFTSEPEKNTISNVACIIQYLESMPAGCLSQFSAVIQYDDGLGNFFKNACKKQEHTYIGLVSELAVVSAKRDALQVKGPRAPFTLICSTEVTRSKDLLCSLEASYNIFVIERDYSRLVAQDFPLTYADVTLSCTHCAVLLSLIEMDWHWDMEKNVKRYLALGLQYSVIFIIAHSIGSTLGYSLGKETVRNLYKLKASLSNLSRSSNCFHAQYKILIVQTESDVASCIRSLADMYISTQKAANTQKTSLSSDMSQQEEVLLRVPCLNTFSAQMLLEKLRPADILKKTLGEIRNAVPELPESVLKYLKEMLPECHLSSTSGSCSSQVSTNNNLPTSSCHPTNSLAAMYGRLGENCLPTSTVFGERPIEAIKGIQNTTSIVESPPLSSCSKLSPSGLEDSSRLARPLSSNKLSRSDEVAKLVPPYFDSLEHSFLHNDGMVGIESNPPHCSKDAFLSSSQMLKDKKQSLAMVEAIPKPTNSNSNPVMRQFLKHTVEGREAPGNIYDEMSVGQYNKFSLAHNFADCTDFATAFNAQSAHLNSRNQVCRSIKSDLSESGPRLQVNQLIGSDSLPHPKHCLSLKGPQGNGTFNEGLSLKNVKCFVEKPSQSKMIDNMGQCNQVSSNTNYNVLGLRKDDLNELVPHYHCLASEKADFIDLVHTDDEHMFDAHQRERSGLSLLNGCSGREKASGNSLWLEKFEEFDQPVYPDFEKALDKGCYMKEETACSKTPYRNNRVGQPCLSDHATEKNAQTSYGIFSSTVRRYSSTMFPLAEEKENFNTANLKPQKASLGGFENSYVKSLFEHIDEKDDKTNFDIRNSSLPFSVSKALKKHVMQAEEQNAYKVPNLFQIAQAGEASSSKRMSRQLRFRIKDSDTDRLVHTSRYTADSMDYLAREINSDASAFLCDGLTSDEREENIQVSDTNIPKENHSGVFAFPQLEQDEYHPPTFGSAQQVRSGYQLVSEKPFCKTSKHSQHLSTMQIQKDSSLMKSFRLNASHENEQTMPLQLGEKENIDGKTDFQYGSVCMENFESNHMLSVHHELQKHPKNATRNQTNYPLKHLAREWNEIESCHDNYGVSKVIETSGRQNIKPSTDAACADYRLTQDCIYRGKQRPESRNLATKTNNSTNPFPDDPLAVAASHCPRQYISKWKKYELDVGETLLQSNSQNKDIKQVPAATTVATFQQACEQHLEGISTPVVDADWSKYGSKDFSPLIDLSDSPAVLGARRQNSLEESSNSQENSKLRKWQAYLQQKTLDKRGE